MDFLKNVTRDDGRTDPRLPVDHEEPPREEGFLNKLAQRINDDDKPDAQVPKPQAPPAEEPSFFDRLQDKISPPPPRPVTPPPPPPPATLGDKISDFFNGNDNEPKVAEHVAPPAPPKEQSFLEKVTGTFADGQYGSTTAAPAPTPVAVPQSEETIADKFSSLLSGRKTPPPPPPPKEESLADKIGGVFGGGKKTPPPPPEDTGLVGHFQKLMGREEEEPKRPETLGDKINSAFGGGAKGEKNEDHLDKAIDLIQEHGFGQGKQHDESASEQFKDERIADAIRSGYKNVTGKEFFIKEKE